MADDTSTPPDDDLRRTLRAVHATSIAVSLALTRWESGVATASESLDVFREVAVLLAGCRRPSDGEQFLRPALTRLQRFGPEYSLPFFIYTDSLVEVDS